MVPVFATEGKEIDVAADVSGGVEADGFAGGHDGMDFSAWPNAVDNERDKCGEANKDGGRWNGSRTESGVREQRAT